MADLDLAAARRDLDRAEQLQPPPAQLRGSQALVLRDSGAWEGSLRLSAEAIALDPRNGDWVNAVALVYGLRGKYAGADPLFRDATVIQGPLLPPFSNRIANRVNWRGPEAALRLVERASPEYAIKEVWRAELLFRLGRGDEARALVERIRPDPPKYPSTNRRSLSSLSIWEQSGNQVETRRFALALAKVEQTEFDRGNRGFVVWQNLIYARLALGDSAQAIDLLQSWLAESAKFSLRSVRSYHFSRLAFPLFARAGLKDEAIALLGELQADGFQFGYDLRSDPDLASLLPDPRFQEQMAKAEAWAKAQPDPTDP
jgi:tetratricopeptide (TPR) repeat protein